jgi:hypothetical protein
MDVSTLYDEDICAWAEQQAAALRRLAATRRDLPNDLDWENIAEEVEDVGNAQRSAAESFLRLIFVHFIKLAVAPQAPPARHWRAEIITFQIELLAKLTPSMPGRIDLDRTWRRALKEARARLAAEGVEPDDAALLPLELQGCPFRLDEFATESFDVDAALSRFPGRT